MLNRRSFLKYITGFLASSSLLSTLSAFASPKGTKGIMVNDIHSQLNTTKVYDVANPKTSLDLQALVKASQSTVNKISIAGARHAMGTQQFGTNTTLIDMREMDKVISLERENKIVEVQSGITWPKLIDWLNKNAPELSIIQKQTGADELTIGGTLAANIHGRGLTHKPIIGDVESFTLISAIGERLECSRNKNSELFKVVIGGYGLFGIVDTVRLRLMGRIKLQRVVEITSIDKLIPAVKDRIAANFMYGDFQYVTDDQSDDFMREGVFSCYKPVSEDTPISTQKRRLDLEDWQKLYALAHVDKAQAYEQYRNYYLSTNGQVYWSDLHQYSTYLKDQNKVLNEARGLTNNASLMITELYVQRDKLTTFMENTRNVARENNMDIIYGTVRFIEKDDESFLPWAKESYASIIFNLEVMHTPEGIEKAKKDFRELIDQALKLNGTYFLTYHRWARKDQVESGYPQFKQFLELKKKYDPEERFSSDWYQHYKQMFNV
jgi:FAD/FMN-containing dehydrogenase